MAKTFMLGFSWLRQVVFGMTTRSHHPHTSFRFISLDELSSLWLQPSSAFPATQPGSVMLIHKHKKDRGGVASNGMAFVPSFPSGPFVFFPSGFPAKILHLCYIPCSSYPPCLNHPTSIKHEAFPTFCYCFSLWSEYSSQHTVLIHLDAIFFPYGEEWWGLTHIKNRR